MSRLSLGLLLVGVYWQLCVRSFSGAQAGIQRRLETKTKPQTPGDNSLPGSLSPEVPSQSSFFSQPSESSDR